MIHGVPADPVLTLIREMEQSEFNFHLTGSRFFGNADENSDWDFFALDTPEIHRWLQQKGFVAEFNNQYQDDPNLASVYRFKSALHIQLVSDTYSKSIIQDALKKAGVLRHYHHNKRAAQIYWKLGYAILESIIENAPKAKEEEEAA